MRPLIQLYMCMFIDMQRFTVKLKSYAYYDHICIEKFTEYIYTKMSTVVDSGW